ncbi:MAG: thiamine-monophosphate kinase [Kiritimatiellae bacterium]|nr:thiamine-monophosphate kinase [Kiritimatiellia bacterium]
MTPLKELGEQKIIDLLTQWLPTREDVMVGSGDDTAVLDQVGSPYDLLLTSDPVIENIHFLPRTPGDQVGHKAVARALSDIAAMGGEPLWVLINIVAPASTETAYLEKIYGGMRQLLETFNTTIVGGDIAEGPTLEIHVFTAGRVPKETAVLRSGAHVGDILYVTGTLGYSWPHKHLHFTPRIKEGRWLREHGDVTSMIDLSDGLATDLRHITEKSQVGAELWESHIPIAQKENHVNDTCTPLEHAFYDGEDYELLFTVPAEKKETFEKNRYPGSELSCTAIGHITPEKNIIKCVQEQGKSWSLEAKGFEHFQIQRSLHKRRGSDCTKL